MTFSASALKGTEDIFAMLPQVTAMWMMESHIGAMSLRQMTAMNACTGTLTSSWRKELIASPLRTKMDLGLTTSAETQTEKGCPGVSSDEATGCCGTTVMSQSVLNRQVLRQQKLSLQTLIPLLSSPNLRNLNLQQPQGQQLPLSQRLRIPPRFHNLLLHLLMFLSSPIPPLHRYSSPCVGCHSRKSPLPESLGV